MFSIDFSNISNATSISIFFFQRQILTWVASRNYFHFQHFAFCTERATSSSSESFQPFRHILMVAIDFNELWLLKLLSRLSTCGHEEHPWKFSNRVMAARGNVLGCQRQIWSKIRSGFERACVGRIAVRGMKINRRQFSCFVSIYFVDNVQIDELEIFFENLINIWK